MSAEGKRKPNRKPKEERKYHLKLFIAGDEPNSREAKKRINRLCETRLKGRCELEIIDVMNGYQKALENNVLVTPTLIISGTSTPIMIVGSLSDMGKVLEALGLEE
ncbi:circadian clock protein KaiB [Candidatus Sumerlaeota bacterium]|nr:circadian clock protein KaiB [Candidatus Sumerlaeota bacterium]